MGTTTEVARSHTPQTFGFGLDEMAGTETERMAPPIPSVTSRAQKGNR
jgi:hypothetical protein